VHGRERRTTRVSRAAKLKELRQLEGLMVGLGMFVTPMSKEGLINGFGCAGIAA
jgi:hypothetical protein